jgi:hypothetical protein
MVKPSWQVTKLTEANGRLLSCWYRSLDPVSRIAKSRSVACRPRQKSRIPSLYLPFHSVHSGGKFPIW